MRAVTLNQTVKLWVERLKRFTKMLKHGVQLMVYTLALTIALS